MSEEDCRTQILQTEDGQMLTAEYRDGQLQIVEVSPFDKDNETQILTELSSAEETRYVQVLDGEKGIVHLDLLSLIKCSTAAGDGETYQMVGSSEDGDTTFTCVLAEDAGTEQVSPQSYVVVEAGREGRGGREGRAASKEPLLYLHSSLQQVRTQQRLRNHQKANKPITQDEIIAKAKLLQKAKSLSAAPAHRLGRKRSSPLPAPMELLTSPGFKLYLYSCKMCSFKCNAMPDMSKHKATAHSCKKAGGGGGGGGVRASLQCPQCPYRATSHSQLSIHTNRYHAEKKHQDEMIVPDRTIAGAGDDGPAVEVLVCGACGFESASTAEFRSHVQDAHSLTLPDSLTTITLEEEDASDPDS